MDNRKHFPLFRPTPRGIPLDFEDFFRAEYARVFRAACLVSGNRDAASDATQDAFGRAFARWSRISRHPWAGGWVTTTAINLCKKELRRRARRLDTSGSLPPDEWDVPDRVDVAAALARLPFRQRQAAVLFYWSDLPTAAIADLMNISDSAVRAHLTHARNALRKTLEVNHA